VSTVDATVEALVAAAPPLDPDRAARLALLLRLDQTGKPATEPVYGQPHRDRG
jgi:hypothetical protein